MTRTALVVAALSAASLLVGPASEAMAWGPQGHRVVARVAESRLTPAAREGVRNLLLEGDSMATVAAWADDEGHVAVPGSAAWHYVNVPLSADRYDPRAHVRGDGVVEKIKHFRKVLADRDAKLQDRRRALLFLIHFVADVHQPLHVGDDGDHGGNDTQVRFFGRPTNLHRVWDSDLIHHVGGDDRAWVARVERLITPASARSWSTATVEGWADESLAAAKVAYRLPGGGRRIGSGADLGEPYFLAVEPIVPDRLARASVRLANELNAIFR